MSTEKPRGLRWLRRAGPAIGLGMLGTCFTPMLGTSATALHAQAEQDHSPWHLVPGLHVGTPAIVSVALAAARTLDRRPDGWRDVFLAVEPGLRAGRISAGYARFEGNLATGFTARVTALRRWTTPANYVGLEGSLHALFLGPRVGVFIPVSDAGNDRIMLTVDLTVGY